MKKVKTPITNPFKGGPVNSQRWNEAHLEKLIEYGTSFKMSDIKFIPDYPPFIRVYGRWYPVAQETMRDHDIEALVAITSNSTTLSPIIKSGNFQDFAYETNFQNDGIVTRRRFRCNATACSLPGGQTGISLVMRRIADKVPTIDEADLVDENGNPNYILQKMLPYQGLVLFTGPTGSGKTTTLAAGIGYLLLTRPETSIETYEDPIEFDYRTAGGTGPLAQMSVSHHLGGNFEKIAPNAARRSSEVVIIGEVRDKASFRGLIQLGDMGMLTISTLHSKSVAETPSRILNTFTADEQPEIKASLIHSLEFIVQQRLLPTVDGKRVAVREYLNFNEKIRYELSNLSPEQMIPYLRQETIKNGQLLLNDVYRKYTAGIISRETFKKMEAENNDMDKGYGG